MVKVHKRLGIVLAAAILLVGCGLGNLTPKQQYLTARIEFNTVQKQYLDYYDNATIEQQAKWKESIDPYFAKAESALDVWGLAVKDGVATGEHLSNYMSLKNDLIDALNEVYGGK